MKNIKDIEVQEQFCIDGANNPWSNDLDFDATDEVLEKFYEHAELCSYHKELIEKADASMVNVLKGMEIAFEGDNGNGGNGEGNQGADQLKSCRYYPTDTLTKYFEGIEILIANNYLLPQNHLMLSEEVSNCNKNFYELIEYEAFSSVFESIVSYRIECDFRAGMTEQNVTLLYFGLSSDAEDSGVRIISQRITDVKESQFRAHFEVVADNEQLERISSSFQNHLGVTNLYVREDQVIGYKCGHEITFYKAFNTDSCIFENIVRNIKKWRCNNSIILPPPKEGKE